jgi:hypothetical protein
MRKVQENQVRPKLNGTHQFLVSYDNVNLLGDNTDTFDAHVLSIPNNVVIVAFILQSIMEPNFRYSGARLCNFLNNEYPPGERSTFRTYLLNR